MGDSQIETVKQRSDVVEIIGERVALKRAGRNYKGLCPFHGEKTPSFFVSPEMQLYKCFGCGAGGDVLAFLENYEGMTFPEALEYLAKRAGVTLVKVYRNEADVRKERLLEIMHLAAEMYHYLLLKHPVGRAAREYLKKRGVISETIKDYRLGYAPNSWQTIEGYLVKKKGYKLEEVVASGLIVKNQDGKTYDRFRGRVMFPQTTANGKTVGMAGRLLAAEAKEAKYINSPETEIYHKGELLYGLTQARAAARKASRIVMVEGEFDVLASVQAHMGETVAIKGSALTREQAILIKRIVPTVILALDADQAGQEAIVRAIGVAEPMGMTLKVVEIRGGKDPDEVAKADPKSWREMVEKAVSVYQFYLDTAFAKYDAKTGLGQKEIVKMTLPVLNKIENKVEQLFYLRKLAEGLGVPMRLVEEEMAKIKAGQPLNTAAVKEKEPAVKMMRREKLERYVVGAGLHLLEEAADYWELLREDWFEEGYLKRIVSKLKSQMGKTKSKKDFLELMEGWDTEIQPTLQELYTEDMAWFEMEPQNLKRSAEKAAADLQVLALRTEIQSLAKAIAREKDAGQVTPLQDQYRTARARLGQINSS